jgi:hypothetical protein
MGRAAGHCLVLAKLCLLAEFCRRGPHDAAGWLLSAAGLAHANVDQCFVSAVLWYSVGQISLDYIDMVERYGGGKQGERGGALESAP